MSSKQQLGEILNSQFKAMEKRAINYYNNPYSPENVHQYRVQMRKLRALLNFLKPVIDKDLYSATNKLLREQGRSLSSIREIDVFIEKASEAVRRNPSKTDNFIKLFKFLEKERLKLRKKQISKKKIKASNNVLSDIEDNLGKIKFSLKNTKFNTYKDFVDQHLAKKVSKLEKEYEKIPHSDYEHTHEMRKNAKRIRYAAEGFVDFLSEKDSKKVAKRTKKIQEELGLITDMHVNIELTEKYIDDQADQELTDQLSHLLMYFS